LIASGTDEDKPVVHIWEKRMKRHHEQSRGYGCNPMTVLILLNIILIIFFALLGLTVSGGRNWFNKRSLETQAIRDPSREGPAAQQILKNAQPLLEQNGIDLNEIDLNETDLKDPKRKEDVIYL
jgi:hypothetical protein